MQAHRLAREQVRQHGVAGQHVAAVGLIYFQCQARVAQYQLDARRALAEASQSLTAHAG
ncbi:hypothetical protein [Azohydromonas lata]|uniref:Uncharacterized protein n=1 Tax=Azohydromonas lata TaxID=45677 RepID=A0ABU5I8P2_9BURK|nr:hypothetical protein [Azohydromonas lata]MDZ5455214.1 hypothetical protein [Azohydromonas lata]